MKINAKWGIQALCIGLLISIFVPATVFGQGIIGDTYVTRSEFVKALLEADNFDPSSITDIAYPFSDVPEDLAPYTERMVLLSALNYTGNEARFDPDGDITLYSALDMAFRYKGVPVPKVVFDPESFRGQVKNIGPNSTVAPVLDKAIKLGLYSPTDGIVNLYVKIQKSDLKNLIQRIAAIDYVSNSHGLTTIKINPIKASLTSNSLQSEKEFKIFADVWKRINSDFYAQDEIDKQQLLYGAIAGLVDGLGDPYSSFQVPDKSRAFKSSLSNDEVDGIGATVTLDEQNRPIIVTPLRNSPAEKAGLKPGDIIFEIDGVSTLGLKLTEVVNKIKGRSGTFVKIKITRNTILHEFDIERATITVTPIDSELTPENILVITVRNFGSGVEDGFEEIIDQVGDTEIKGIVFDLRNNPGGYLTSAVDLASHFIDEGEVVANIKYGNGTNKNDISKGPAEYGRLPVAILINGGSASAAEIFAAALREQVGAVLVGEKSFGKGTVQELIDFRDESTLKLTTANWLTPHGVSINKVGVEPDYRVTISDYDKKLGIDPQMYKSLQLIKQYTK